MPSDKNRVLASFQAREYERAAEAAQTRADRYRSPDEKRDAFKKRLIEDIDCALDHFLRLSGEGWTRAGSVSRDHDAQCFRHFAEAARAYIDEHEFRSLGDYARWLLTSMRNFRAMKSRRNLSLTDIVRCERSIDMIHEITKITFRIAVAAYPEKGIEEILEIIAKYVCMPIDDEPPPWEGPLN